MGLRAYLFNDLGRKLVSLCLAALIWFNIWFNNIRPVDAGRPKLSDSPIASLLPKPQTEKVTGKFEQIPITVLSLAQDRRAYNLDARQVRIVVSGERRQLNNLTAKDINVVVDLTDLASARKSDSATNPIVRTVQVRSPEGISVVKVEPPVVLVEPIPRPETAAKPTERDE